MTHATKFPTNAGDSVAPPAASAAGTHVSFEPAHGVGAKILVVQVLRLDAVAIHEADGAEAGAGEQRRQVRANVARPGQERRLAGEVETGPAGASRGVSHGRPRFRV